MKSPGSAGPQWRVRLEDRWQARLGEVTQLSLAYHVAAETGETGPEAQRLLRRAVAARRELEDTEEALRRLAAGNFGHCEQCMAAISPQSLLAAPESRYCPRCMAGYVPSPREEVLTP